MSNNKLPRRDIQFLRALAVLAVIAYHFKIAGFGGGFVGVDIFFVISGYLIFGQIHAQLIQQNFSLNGFFEARLRRIFPALAVVCVATALWGWHFVLPRDYRDFSRTALAALCFVSNFALTGAKGYFDAAADAKPLLHTWSLSVEGQFYLWLPLILLPYFKMWRGRVHLALVFTAIASLTLALYLVYKKTPDSGFYSVSARAWEFVAGAIIATLDTGQHKHTKTILLACMLGLVMSVSLLDGSASWPNMWTLLPVGCAAAFIYFAVNAQQNPIVAHPSFQLIGNMSYSLYLWHWPVLVFARQIYGDSIQGAGKIALLLLITVLSYLSWRWVEQPFRDRSCVTSKQIVRWMLATLLCAVMFTAFVVISKGYPKRFPDYVGRAAVQGQRGPLRGECMRSGSNTKETAEQFCVYGASSQVKDATTMLWGDSHANQYLTALINASTALGNTGLIATMSGCRPFIETDAIQYPDFPHCKDFNREVFAYLIGHPKIETVILGRIWFDSDETIGRTVLLIRQLIAHGHKVILLAPLPLPGMHVESAWAMKQIQAGHPIDDIKLDSTPQVRQSSILSKLGNQLKAEVASGKLFLLDPTQRLCDAQFCYVVRDGVANFRDTSHLTEAAAQKMEPDIRSALIWAKQRE